MSANATETVTELPDIAAEQAALAAGTKAATENIEQASTPAKSEPEVKAPEADSEELTPAAKQAKAAEEAENQLTSFDDFLNQKNTGKKPVAPATKQAESTQESKVTESKTTTAEATKQERDLTGIAPEHQALFKQMSNEAFNVLKTEYVAKRQLETELAEARKGAIPPSYYEHEQAYVLSPEFAQQSDVVSQAEDIHKHYTAQLAELRGGAETYTILQRNAQGQLVVSAPIKADRNTVDQMADVRQSAYQQLMNAQAQLNAIGNVHRQRAGEYKQQLNDFESKAFPLFTDKPEHKAVVADTIQKVLPAAYRNNPLAPAFAKALITVAELGKALQAKQQPAPATTTTKTQPSAAEISSGGAAPVGAQQKEEVTFDMFKQAKRGMLR